MSNPNRNNPPRQPERVPSVSASAAPPALVAPPAQPVPPVAKAPKAAPPEPVAPPAPVALEGFVLARWTGLGAFGGRWYTHPEREERTGCRGPTLGYFDAVSIAKLREQFECDAMGGEKAVPLAQIVGGAEPPSGHVLARWKGAGRYSGPLFSAPDRRPLTHCVGPTVGFFPVESVEKLGAAFEKL